MGIFRQFPYSNFHEMNMDWLLSKMKELESEFNNFVIDTTDLIKNAVYKWLMEHPEYVAPDLYKTLNELALHKVAPVYISENPFIPSTHLANGFTADDTYFYIAHHVNDEEFLTITRVNKSTLESNDYSMPFTGHGNTLSYYNGYLYICDSSSGRVDVVSTEDPETLIGSFNLDPAINGFSIALIDGRILTCSTEHTNNIILNGYIDDNNKNQIFSRIAMNDDFNCYTQGIDHTRNCIYVSRSYGQHITSLENLPTITAYSWSGKMLNTMYINIPYSDDTRDNELEDIWRDSENNRIYFITASGKIGYVDTYLFTTGQSHHVATPYTIRNSEFMPMVLYDNDNTQITYRSNTQLAESFKINPFSTANQGEYIGVGLIAGINAIFSLRAGAIFGYTTAITSGSNIMSAVVEYDISGDTATFNSGSVYILNNDGTITKQSLQDFSDNHATNRTVINSLVHTPYAIPYTTQIGVIPVAE